MLTTGVYLATLLFYSLGPHAHSRTANQIFAILSVATLLILFWHGYRVVKTSRNGTTTKTVVIFGLILAAITFFTLPFHSTDVFGYINRGWQQAHYHENPYSHPLVDVPDWQSDPMLREHWVYNPDPYGFLFTLLARGLCTIGNGHWWLTLFLFKGVNFLAYCGTAAILWRGARLLARTQPITTLYLFLWNPLVLMHCLANGHNDVITGFMLVLAFYCAIVGNWFWVIPALTGAGLLKYAPGLLIPVAFVFVVRHRGWKAAVASVILSVLLVVVVSLPYLRDFDSVRIWNIEENATLIDNSLHSFLIHIFEDLSRIVHPLAALHQAFNEAIKIILRGGFIVFLVWQWIKAPRDFRFETFARKSLLILLVLFCLATSKFNAWYMAILLPLALLIAEDYWLRRLVLLITAAELLSLTFFKQAYVINYGVMILLPMLIIWQQEYAAAHARTIFNADDETAGARAVIL